MGDEDNERIKNDKKRSFCKIPQQNDRLFS